MKNKKEGYIDRLIDKKIDRYLKVFGAVSIEGPKWCGKTWAGLAHSNSVVYLSDENRRKQAEIDLNLVIYNEYPELIDEWQIVPTLWDKVRLICDSDNKKGKFILTGSTTILKEDEEKVYHSGVGRIATLRMDPMSLYESKDSSGDISLIDLLNNNVESKFIKKVTIDEIIYLIIRGGWPDNLNVDKEDASLIPISYIDTILKKDIHERKDKKRDSEKMRLLLKSLARNESTLTSDKTIIRDILEYGDNEKEYIKSSETFSSYYQVLNDLYLISNQNAFSINYRSSARIGKQVKRHLVDPSLVCALLSLNKEKLLNDMDTLGFLFESLVERDLRIYMSYLEGNLYHFKDNVSHDKVDAIVEFKDGSYGAIEIKLSINGIKDGIKSLLTFYEHAEKKPKFMCIIIGLLDGIAIDKDSGIYLIPLTSLKP